MITRALIEAAPRTRLGKVSPLKADLFRVEIAGGACVVKDVKKKRSSSACSTAASPSPARRASTAASTACPAFLA
ncbi:MAG: hypothetical protein HY719_07270 [Planctomycetes bacterium]|nr:hypothetical protein [Planctomycetota bacterium]